MLIVLCGTSSSGKTSLAQALQQLAPRPLFHIEADRFAPTLPEGHPAKQDAAFCRRGTLAMHEAIAAFARSGVDVIADGSLPTELPLRDECLVVLRSVPGTVVVAVRCSVGALREREAGRPDRLAGWAEESLPLVYDGIDFDATVDTTGRSPEEAARELLAALFGE